MMQFVDTHCHIHFPDYQLEPELVINEAADMGVTKLLCVGCTLADSKLGIAFAHRYPSVWASIGLHPHEADDYVNDSAALQSFSDLATKDRVVAIGEAGLDYYYQHSDKKNQQKLLRFQMAIAKQHNLPMIFHVRDAFEDFWPIYDEYKVPGVIHSFSATKHELSEALKRDLFIGLNGIMTFTKNADQLEAAKAVPLSKLLLETDAPFLTPTPYRGIICQPKHVVVTAEFLSGLRNQTLAELAEATTNNATILFNI